VPYHGHELTVIWDRDGTKYHHARIPTPHQQPPRHPADRNFFVRSAKKAADLTQADLFP
jgi:hypothetical protein